VQRQRPSVAPEQPEIQPGLVVVRDDAIPHGARRSSNGHGSCGTPLCRSKLKHNGVAMRESPA
jgi:hypothetical protein